MLFEKSSHLNIHWRYQTSRSKIKTFDNTTQKVLYKEYQTLKLIDGELFRIEDDKEEGHLLQFVLPINQIGQAIHQEHVAKSSGH